MLSQAIRCRSKLDGQVSQPRESFFLVSRYRCGYVVYASTLPKPPADNTLLERSDLVKSARGGGSITPRFAKVLEKHARAGGLSMHTHTTITYAAYHPSTSTWTILTDPPIADLPPMHHVYFATGVQSDFSTLPYLSTIVDKHPVESFDGLPALTDDLMWTPEVPLFLTGRFAALRLGPGAANLEGARIGAERVVWGLREVLKMEGHGGEESEGGNDGVRYASGIGSRFGALEVEE